MFDKRRAFRGRRAMDDELVPEDFGAATHNGRVVQPYHLEGNPSWGPLFVGAMLVIVALAYCANPRVY